MAASEATFSQDVNTMSKIKDLVQYLVARTILLNCCNISKLNSLRLEKQRKILF